MRLSVLMCLLFSLGSTVTAQPGWMEVRKDGSLMTYRLVHPLHEVEATSKSVHYTAELDSAKRTITAVKADVDVTTFDSGNSNRDSHAMEVIDALDYPEATFSSTSITQKGDSLAVAGKLTFHGVTRDIVIPALAKWSGRGVAITGAFHLSLTEYHVERPALFLIPVDDTLSFTFTAAFAW